MEAGQDAALFWRLTLREIHAVLKGAAKRRDGELRMRAWQAWTTAALTISAVHKPKKFPKLDKVLPKAGGTARQPQSWQQQKMIAMALNAMHGGEEKRRG